MPEQQPPRYVATYAPEAWVNDYAVPIDVDGPNTWDCTDYLTSCGDYGTRIAEKLQTEYSVIDTDDVLAQDPTAPELVRSHRGPFTVTVRLAGGREAALRALAPERGYTAADC